MRSIVLSFIITFVGYFSSMSAQPSLADNAIDKQAVIEHEGISEKEATTILEVTSSLPAEEKKEMTATLCHRVISWNHNWVWWCLILIPVWFIFISLGRCCTEMDDIKPGKYPPLMIWLAWLFLGLFGLHRMLMRNYILFTIGIIALCTVAIGLLKPIVIYYPILSDSNNWKVIFYHNWGAWVLLLCWLLWFIDIFFNIRYTLRFKYNQDTK